MGGHYLYEQDRFTRTAIIGTATICRSVGGPCENWWLVHSLRHFGCAGSWLDGSLRQRMVDDEEEEEELHREFT